jgi:hypothetical protein
LYCSAVNLSTRNESPKKRNQESERTSNAIALKYDSKLPTSTNEKVRSFKKIILSKQLTIFFHLFKDTTKIVLEDNPEYFRSNPIRRTYPHDSKKLMFLLNYVDRSSGERDIQAEMGKNTILLFIKL